MRISRSALQDRVDRLASRAESLETERDARKADADASAGALLSVSAELSMAKDVIASHIIGASHPSSFLLSPQQAFEALRRALTDAGVDLRIELARQSGVER